MTDSEQNPPQNGRDIATGRFVRGNLYGRIRRRRAMLEAPAIPDFLKGHAGVRALWPMLGALATGGNGQAITLMSNLCLGLTTPKHVGPEPEIAFEEEEFDEDEGY